MIDRTVQFAPFRPAHLAAINPRGDVAPIFPLMVADDKLAVWLASGPVAITASARLRIIGCGGVVAISAELALAWLVASAGVRRCHWPAITGMVVAMLDLAATILPDDLRIQTAVRADFAAGERWARRLGFEARDLVERPAPDGAFYRLYERAKETLDAEAA